MDRIRWVIQTGWPSKVESRLRRKLGAIGRHIGFHMKIGITNWPENRWQAYRRAGWLRMYVIYQTNSLAAVRYMEDALIIHLNEQSRVAGYGHNVNRGGGGPMSTIGPYYVYVVVARKHARLD